MNPFAAYRAINAKLHARRRTLLSDKEWEKVTELKSVSQVTDFLKKRQGYKNLFSESKIENYHRIDLEVMLDRYIVKEIENMLHYFSGSYKAFFKIFLMEYEINDLQLMLRSIARNESVNELEQFFVHSQKYGLPIYQKLLACKSVAQFIDALKGTLYYDALKTMVQEDVIKREFHMEMKLYVLFYQEFTEKAEALSPKDRKIAKEIIGTRVDYANVQWIYRAIKYFDISQEEILIYSLPFGNKITYQKLKALSYAKNIDEFKKMAQKFIGKPLFEEENDAFLGRTIDRLTYKDAIKMKNNEESIATSLAYIYTLYIEVQDMIALTEGIRYTLPEHELRKYLVHTI